MKKRIDKFVEVLREHIIFSMIVSGILGAIISWLFGWVLPTKPVEVGNLPQKELTCTLNFSQNLINKRTNDDKFQILNCTPFVRQYDILNNKWGDFYAKRSTK